VRVLSQARKISSGSRRFARDSVTRIIQLTKGSNMVLNIGFFFCVAVDFFTESKSYRICVNLGVEFAKRKLI
jgi:hypothetical protein